MELKYADLHFRAVAANAEDFPTGYLGKTIRGAFGIALRRLVCHDSRGTCDTCLLRERCPYSIIFEGVPQADRSVMRKYPRVPPPLVLVLDRPGRGGAGGLAALTFGLRLFGPAIDGYPYIVHAAREMLQRGIGRQRVPFTLKAVSDGRRTVYEETSAAVRAPSEHRLHFARGPGQGANRISLTCITPLSLVVEGRAAEVPTLEAVLRSAVRRARVMVGLYGSGVPPAVPCELLDAARASRIVRSNLRWLTVPRYSSRQRRRLMLGGIVGSIEYHWPAGAPDPAAWLQAAEILHLGKATTFGFGRILFRTEPA